MNFNFRNFQIIWILSVQYDIHVQNFLFGSEFVHSVTNQFVFFNVLEVGSLPLHGCGFAIWKQNNSV